jgi:hypothetical protein
MAKQVVGTGPHNHMGLFGNSLSDVLLANQLRAEHASGRRTVSGVVHTR